MRPCSSNRLDRKSTRLNSSHLVISYAVFCLKIKGAGGTVRPISAAIAPAMKLHGRERAVLLHSRREFQKDGMAPAVAVKYLLVFFLNVTRPPQLHPLPPHDALLI